MKDSICAGYFDWKSRSLIAGVGIVFAENLQEIVSFLLFLDNKKRICPLLENQLFWSWLKS